MIDAARRQALQKAIMEGHTYRLADQDTEFLAGDDLRPLRLQLEMIKPEHELRANDVRSTVVVFGSARIPSPERSRELLAAAQAAAASGEADPQSAATLSMSKRRVAQSEYYEQARRFSNVISSRFQQEGRRDFVIMTGGGPGIMEAANLGAFEAGARSIGLNIMLPHEEAPNPFVSPELAFRFHYFALRKMHFLLRARAMVAFPGGFGTLDELFEVLTLVQTGKMPRIPIVLVGSAFWRRVIDFEFLVDQGFIAPTDLKLFTCVDNADQIVAVLEEFYDGNPPNGPGFMPD